MIEIKRPVLNSEINVSIAYIDSFVSDILSYKIGNEYLFTDCNVVSGMTSRTYYSNYPSSMSLSGSISATSYTVECTPNTIFLKNGYKFIFSNVIGASTKILVGKFNYSNGYFTAIRHPNDAKALVYFINTTLDSDANRKNYTTQVYKTPNAVLMSFLNVKRYVIFAKFKSIFNPNEYKYYIFASMQTGAVNENGQLIVLDNTIPVADGAIESTTSTRYAAIDVIQNTEYRAINSSEDVIVQKYVYGSWYCDDLYTITGLSFDVPTLISGRQYYPLGNNLYLLVKD